MILTNYQNVQESWPRTEIFPLIYAVSSQLSPAQEQTRSVQLLHVWSWCMAPGTISYVTCALTDTQSSKLQRNLVPSKNSLPLLCSKMSPRIVITVVNSLFLRTRGSLSGTQLGFWCLALGANSKFSISSENLFFTSNISPDSLETWEQN